MMTSKTNNSTVESPVPLEEDIRLIAYYLWEEKGSNNDTDIENWIEAEKYLNN